MRNFVIAVAVLFVALPLAAARTLYWEAVDVDARLDAEGRLHVAETQSYVFDGDWNGGERIFRLEPGQSLQFEGMSRVGADGTARPLTEGSLDEVDHYQFTSEKTLRWRSRLPSDPPFANERITYRLQYTLSNILLQSGSGYVLDHDFAFPSRSGEIRTFTLDLDLDPVWRAPGLVRHVERSSLAPGRSVVVRAELEHTGGGVSGARRDTRPIRRGLAAVTIFVPLLLAFAAYRRERDLGRFAPLTTSSITAAWIEEHVLTVRPEVIGAAWDQTVGASEVAALLARWAAEGKIAADAKGKKSMEMRLLVPRDRFEGHERELVDKLFFDGKTTTSTDELRSHYKQSGFQPATVISPALTEAAAELTRGGDPAPPIAKWPTALLFLAAVGLFVFGMTMLEGRPERIVIPGIATLIFWIAGTVLAAFWRIRVDFGLGNALTFLVPVAAVVVIALRVLGMPGLPWALYLAFVAAALMVARNVFNIAMSKEGRAGMAYRKRLTSVRDYFSEQLERSDPALDDRWFPWLLAFGLDGEADKWASRFGAASRSTGTSSFDSGSPGGSTISSSGWSGGGGAFGGAGATGTWAAAATGIAAGVASASSSSGSGGGGGGGSSGGGGGGGW